MEWKRISTVVAVAALALTAAACSSSGGKGKSSTSNSVGAPAPSSGGSTSAGVPDPTQQPKSKVKAVTLSGDCAPFGQYGHYNNATVTMYTSITDPEGHSLQVSWQKFEQCTGITIKYTADKEFETAIKTKVQGGNAPDIAVIPQPGLLDQFATSGDLKPASDALTKEAEANWVPSWIQYGSVQNHFFAAPMGANLKSLLWYSPKYFKQYHYTVPTTWSGWLAEMDKMAADGHKPLCAGIESGTATGWPATDWLEEVVLRKYGPDVYDQWINHTIPFNDPRIVDAMNVVQSIWLNPKYVNAGIGNVKSIATTAFQSAGLPVEHGTCMFHQQANFYGANWEKPYINNISPTGDIYAAYLPTMSDKFGKVIEGGGEFVGAFSDRPEVEATQLYLASGDWATSRAKVATGWLSANQKVDKTAFTDPVDKLSVDILTDPNATFRFDASDSMPGSVGAGTEWTQLTQWVLGNKSSKQAADAIEASWPK